MSKRVQEMVTESASTYMFQATVAAVVILIAYLLNRLVLRKAIKRFATTAELEPHYTTMIERFGSIVLYLAALSIILANLGVSGLLYGLLATLPIQVGLPHAKLILTIAIVVILSTAVISTIGVASFPRTRPPRFERPP